MNCDFYSVCFLFFDIFVQYRNGYVHAVGLSNAIKLKFRPNNIWNDRHYDLEVSAYIKSLYAGIFGFMNILAIDEE